MTSPITRPSLQGNLLSTSGAKSETGPGLQHPNMREPSSHSAAEIGKRYFKWTNELTNKLKELLNDPRFHNPTMQGFYNVRRIADTLGIDRKVVTSKMQTLRRRALQGADSLAIPGPKSTEAQELTDHQLSNSAPPPHVRNRKPDFKWTKELTNKLEELLKNPEFYNPKKHGQRNVQRIAEELGVDRDVVASKIQTLEIKAKGKEAQATQALAKNALAERAPIGSESNLIPAGSVINTFLSSSEIEEEIAAIESVGVVDNPIIYFSRGPEHNQSPIPHQSPGVEIPYLLANHEVAQELMLIEGRGLDSIKP